MLWFLLLLFLLFFSVIAVCKNGISSNSNGSWRGISDDRPDFRYSQTSASSWEQTFNLVPIESAWTYRIWRWVWQWDVLIKLLGCLIPVICQFYEGETGRMKEDYRTQCWLETGLFKLGTQEYSIAVWKKVEKIVLSVTFLELVSTVI